MLPSCPPGRKGLNGEAFKRRRKNETDTDKRLENQTSLEPKELMTDTAGYSDIVFGLFWLLGFQFSPRLAYIGELRFWRLDCAANYGVLNGVQAVRVQKFTLSRPLNGFWE